MNTGRPVSVGTHPGAPVPNRVPRQDALSTIRELVNRSFAGDLNGETRTRTGDTTIFSGPRGSVRARRGGLDRAAVRVGGGWLAVSWAGTRPARDVSGTLLVVVVAAVDVVELCSAGSGQPDIPSPSAERARFRQVQPVAERSELRSRGLDGFARRS